MKYPALILCSSISTLMPFLAGIMVFHRFKKDYSSLVLLWMFFALAVVTECAVHIVNSLSKSSAWIAHIYTLAEFSLIASLLAAWQTKSALVRGMRLSILIYALFFAFIKIIGLENFSADTANFITRPLALLLLVTFAFLTLQDLWRQISSNLANDYRFWMLLAMVFYYSTSLGLFAFMFTKQRETLDALFKIHAVVNIIHNFLFTIGVFKVRAAQQVALEPTSAS